MTPPKELIAMGYKSYDERHPIQAILFPVFCLLYLVWLVFAIWMHVDQPHEECRAIGYKYARIPLLPPYHFYCEDESGKWHRFGMTVFEWRRSQELGNTQR